MSESEGAAGAWTAEQRGGASRQASAPSSAASEGEQNTAKRPSEANDQTQCEDAAGFYRRKFDWPCTALGHCVWTLAGEAVDAVDIPEGLGRRAMSALRGQGRPHSVIEIPGADTVLRFLVQPRTSTPRGVVGELVRRGGTYLNQATIIELPPTRVIGGELSWVRGPVSTLPALHHVVGAIAGNQNKSGKD